MFIKKEQRQILYWIGATIIFSWVGVLFFIVWVELLSKTFATLAEIFFWIAFLCMLWTFVLIIRNTKGHRAYIIIYLAILVWGIAFAFAFFSAQNENFRSLRATSGNTLLYLNSVKDVINEYIRINNQMPEKNFWYNSLLELEERSKSTDIDSEKPKLAYLTKPNFAFNENLSNVPVKGLAGNLVLIFEAYSDDNLSGGPELIKKTREKDRHFLFKRDVFIYVLFVDGTVIKYRLNDGAVAKYDKNKAKYYMDRNAFTNYVPQGKTPYSPLKWK
jgi:hypothetical protein